MTLVPTGARRTKVCKEHGHLQLQDIEKDGLCRLCHKERNERYNTRNNSIRLLAHRIAGVSQQAFFKVLSRDRRDECRELAEEMFDLGVDIGTADRAEATERRGFVYIITNKAWSGYVKIGRAFDPEARLRGYQTSCPWRDYVMNYAVYFEDCYQAERSVHSVLDKWRRGGEWFFADVEEATEIIDRLRETTTCGQRS